MALDNITLADGQGVPVNHTFSYVGSQGNRVIRNDLAAPLEEPISLSIAHSDTKINGAPSKSHLWRIDRTFLDADGVTPYKVNIRVMADIPNSVLTDARVDDLAAFVRNWFTSTNARNWARGSVG